MKTEREEGFYRRCTGKDDAKSTSSVSRDQWTVRTAMLSTPVASRSGLPSRAAVDRTSEYHSNGLHQRSQSIYRVIGDDKPVAKHVVESKLVHYKMENEI